MASATFQLKAVDETAQAFASVQNNMQRLQNSANNAGRALIKGLDVRGSMHAVAAAIGLNVDAIANAIARLVTGTSAEEEKLSEKGLSLMDTLESARKQNSLSMLNDAQLMIRLDNERINLQNKMGKGAGNLGTQSYNTSLEEQIRLEQVLSQIQVIKVRKSQEQLVISEAYGKVLDDRRNQQIELDSVFGKNVDKEALLNHLLKSREVFLTQIDQIQKEEPRNIAATTVANQNLIDVTKEIIPLEQDRRKLGMDAGQAIAQGFEDAALSGKSLREVLKGVAQDLLRLVFQKTVTAPLAGIIGNFLAGARAEGGPVGAGQPYMVGERGPELFVPSSSGSIIPNGSRGGSMGGYSVNITYNIASGVSRSELVPILESERKRLKSEIPDMVRRGGSYRSAFA